jgi:hypothetical protein
LKSKRFNKFSLAPKVLDTSTHASDIQKAIFCNSANLILAFEKYSKEIKFYDTKLNQVKREKLQMKK